MYVMYIGMSTAPEVSNNNSLSVTQIHVDLLKRAQRYFLLLLSTIRQTAKCNKLLTATVKTVIEEFHKQTTETQTLLILTWNKRRKWAQSIIMTVIVSGSEVKSIIYYYISNSPPFATHPNHLIAESC